jgi:TolB-like protein
MASLISGYEYDIFISYRQKDNKYDGWVTEFVDNLKRELEATFKEDVSVYFDINPHDGLLETHDVNASLKDKLKCLVFIPIISRTYCDPKSFAWEHEFKAFVEKSSQDQFGLRVKLADGNVANRVLPVRIHDLDKDDIKQCESVLGGKLRGVEFTYKSPGVNRPLRAKEENPQDNLTHSNYRDQINKVANATREIIKSLRFDGQEKNLILFEDFSDQQDLHHEEKTIWQKNKKLAVAVLLMLLLSAGFIFVFKLLNKERQESKLIDKSVAVLPFLDYSANHDQEYLANGMVEEILNQLASIKDLIVIARTSSMTYKDSKLPIKTIAHQLGASNIVEGSVQKSGDSIRITVQMIDGQTQEHLWSKTFDRELSNLFSTESEISMNIARELKAILTSQETEMIRQIPTNNHLAHDYYLKGKQFREDGKNKLAVEMLNKAIEQDPEFALAYIEKASIFTGYFWDLRSHRYDSLAKANLGIAQKISPDLPEVKFEQISQLYRIDRNHDKALELLVEIKSQMTNDPRFFTLRAAILRRKGHWEEAQDDWKRAALLDPLTTDYYIQIGSTYTLMRRYSEAMEYYNKPKLLGLQSESQGFEFYTLFSWKGDIEEALRISGLSVTDLGYFYFYLKRQYDKLIPLAEKTEDQYTFIPKTLNLAEVYFLNEKIPLSKQYADSAILEINLRIEKYPEDDRYYAALGYAYAYKGESSKAIENAQKAVMLKPLKLDAWQGFERERDLANIYTLAGEYDLAMDKIEYLLTIPGGLSVQLLKVDPAYNKLHNLPRFKKILKTKYITRY